MKRVFLMLAGMLMVGCTALRVSATATATTTADAPRVLVLEENPYAPKNDDIQLKQEEVELTSVSLSELYELSPIRAELHLLGSMPSVCSELRVKVNAPNEAYQIRVEVYSVAEMNVKCNKVFQQFKVSLVMGEYTQGQYTVWVNDRMAGTLASY